MSRYCRGSLDGCSRGVPVVVALAALSLVACAGGGVDTQTSHAGGVGRVAISLMVGDEHVHSVHYVVTDSGGAVVAEDDIAVHDANATASVELGLPAGTGYTIEMTATTEAGTQCAGSQTFDVIANQTTEVFLNLLCDARSDGNDVGSARVNATLVAGDSSTCPDVASYSVSALQVSVGGTIALAGAASSSPADIGWTANAGTIADPNIAGTTFTCTEPGSAVLRLTVSLAPSCEDSETIEVTCVEAPAGDGDGDQGGDGDGDGNQGGDGDQGSAQSCSAIVEACHAKDSRDGGDVSQCHEIGHAGDEAACQAEEDACVALCDAAPVPSQEVSIEFAAVVGSQPFECGTTYSVGSTGVDLEPLDFRFYVQDVRLITDDGTEVPVVMDAAPPYQTPDVALIDFEDDAGNCLFNGGDATTNTTIAGVVPDGHSYVGVAFRNGVPFPNNHGDVTVLGAPYDAPGMQWNWLGGFRFIRAEFSGAGQFHLGSSGCSGDPVADPGSVTCTNENRNEVRFETGFDPSSSVIVADLGATFAGTDLSSDVQCHSSGAACESMFAAAGVTLSDGGPSATQTMYHIE